MLFGHPRWVFLHDGTGLTAEALKVSTGSTAEAIQVSTETVAEAMIVSSGKISLGLGSIGFGLSAMSLSQFLTSKK